MDKEILKGALFGYSKLSVCQYIAAMNEAFHAKLLEEAEAFREERLALQKKIDELETELAAQKKNACDVGSVLLEAGQYAEQLRRQAQEEAEQLRSQTKNETDQLLLEMKAKVQIQTKKIALYTGAIGKLREDMAVLANRTDDALNAFAEQFLSLRQEFEDHEL